MATSRSEGDAEWLVRKASECLKTNCYAARSWLITAKTLFPDNFSIQFEAYGLEKSSKNTKEAAKLLQDMFVKFPKEPRLQREVQDISEAIQSDATDSNGLFLKDVFAAVPSSVQCQILLSVSQDVTAILDQCRMMLILVTRFPQLIVEHGVPLIDKLISTEKHAHFPSCLNCYRKILVDDVLPLVLAHPSLNVPQKQIYRWLQKSIEFYISYVAQPPVQSDTGLLSPDLKSPTKRSSSGRRTLTIAGLSEKEAHISKPLERLHQVLELAGKKMEWPAIDIFNKKASLDAQFQSVNLLYERSLHVDSSLTKPVLYYATTLYLECCYQYTSQVEPHLFAGCSASSTQLPLVLIEGLTAGDNTCSSPVAKKSKTASSCPIIHMVGEQGQGTNKMVDSFVTAVRLWDLLHSRDTVEKDYKKLSLHLKSDSWHWMKLFECDRLLYQGQFREAINKLTASAEADTRINLQLASCYYALGQYSGACEKVLAMIASLPQGSEPPSRTGGASDPVTGRHLQMLPCTAGELLPYCIHLLLTCLKEKAFSNNSSDDMLGHMIVLLQYDWPKYEDLFEKAVHKISAQKTFVYNLFFTYITNIDILEEFAFLKSSHDVIVQLDILPTSTKVMVQQRTVTRGVQKGVSEDFRMTMERQVARCDDNIEQVIRQFLVEEREQLLADLS